MLLLDTHVWIWSVEGDVRRIGRRARQLLARAESQDAIRISPATLFEVAALHTAGRLHLTIPLTQWMNRTLAAPGLRIVELSPAMALDAGSIARDSLPDSMDRILVATARQLEATLLTSDARILSYAAGSRNVRVRDANI